MDVTAADLSALCRIVNTGMQSAARQLSGLLGENIRLAVAHVTISPLEQVLPLFGWGMCKWRASGNRCAAVWMAARCC